MIHPLWQACAYSGVRAECVEEKAGKPKPGLVAVVCLCPSASITAKKLIGQVCEESIPYLLSQSEEFVLYPPQCVPAGRRPDNLGVFFAPETGERTV
jgi:hypothetical protein